MTIIDKDPSFRARVNMRAKSTRYHPGLFGQLFCQWCNKAITDHLPHRAYVNATGGKVHEAALPKDRWRK